MSGGIVDLGGSHRAVKLVLVHAVVVAELLELAVAASDAGEALLVMVGEKQLKGGLSAVAHGGSIGEYFHTLVDGVHAGGNQRTGALDFDNADTAGADGVDLRQVAKCGYFNSGIACCFKNCRTLRDGNRHAVDFNIDHIHFSNTPFLLL